MVDKQEIEECSNCGKKYIVKWIRYPSRLDDDRLSFIDCPYCGYCRNIKLAGNEDVTTCKYIKTRKDKDNGI